MYSHLNNISFTQLVPPHDCQGFSPRHESINVIQHTLNQILKAHATKEMKQFKGALVTRLVLSSPRCHQHCATPHTQGNI